MEDLRRTRAKCLHGRQEYNFIGYLHPNMHDDGILNAARDEYDMKNRTFESKPIHWTILMPNWRAQIEMKA